jgi:hypothetical protein
VTQPPNWHGLVTWDLLLNAVATGLFLVTAAAHLARPGLFAGVSLWVYPVALAVLLADLSCLVLDLGDPLRFHHMLRVFKPSSPMSLGTWCLSAFAFPLAAVAALDVFALAGWLPADALSPARSVFVIAALPFAFGSAAYKGVLFSTTAQPGWRDARWLGAYHVASALAIGGGLLWAAAELGGYAGAAVLRPAVAVLAAMSVLPTALLAVELRPAVAGVHTPAATAVIAAVAVAGPIAAAGLTLAGGVLPAVLAAAALLVAGYAVRSVIVHLPHRVPGEP